jgi:NodT family efflux transporter outer membrane factor (OMF) lipoprotein
MARRVPDIGHGNARAGRRHWICLASLAAVLLCNTGCIATGPLEYIRNGFKVGPNYSRPPAPVAAEWIQANDANVQNRQLQDWWSVFEDPMLNALIETSYNQNLTLRAVGMRVLQSRAQLAIAAGNLFPQTQQATGSYSRAGLSRNAANNPANLNPLFATLGSGINAIPASAIPVNFFSDWQAGLNMSWELDFWGRFRRAVESANANLDSSIENYDAALVTLLADVATTYVQYRIAQERIKIAKDNVDIQEGVLALVEQQYRVGINKVTELDVDQAKSVLEQTRSTVPALEIVLGQANDMLCTLLGLPPHDLEAEFGPVTNKMLALVPSWVAVGIPADLLRRRPDVRSAERQVAAQSAQIGVAEADLYPAIFITGSIGYEAQNISQLFESQSFIGTIMPNFKWNILNYGRITNNVRLQQAKTQELIATYQNEVLTAAQQVQSALRAFLRSREQTEDLAKSVTAIVAATQISVQQYKAGTVPFNTVFNLETTQVQQQDHLAVAQGNIALNLISVYRALGGGWELRLQKEANSRKAELGEPRPTDVDHGGPRRK